MTLVLHYAARSDRGLVRSNNQDSVYAGPRLLALADGMGGHAAGEVASKVVIAALAPLDDDEPGDDLLGDLRDAMVSGNSAISDLVASDPELDGMGTTLTAVLFAGSRLGLVHVGDSRAYMVRDGELSQITHDDTFVQSLIDEGRITEEEAANHPQRSLLLRALTGHEIEPSLTVREARAGDRYLLCSDGLSSVVSEETIAEALRISDPQQCADRMIELALKGGGPDNVTVIVADVVDVEFGNDAPIVGGAAGFGDEDPQPDSAAARASAATMPARQQPQWLEESPPPDPPPRKRRWLRSLLVTGGILVVLAGMVFAGRWWVFNQYFIGVNRADEVVIFQGVQGSMLGISLHRQVEKSCPPGAAESCRPIGIKDLKQAQRPDVRNGNIPVNGLDNAREAIRNLRMRALLPECEKSDPPPSDQPPQPPNSSGQPNPPTDPNKPGPPTASGQPPNAPGATDTTPPSSSSTVVGSATPLETATQTPGVTCRTVS
ncbi:protein phosphatase [Saccharopolyspora lacisalsi]|uniref:Serine/threonine protein phosphatase PstP n=1 Tax=Halosaccharopolyspora lacisalsi TaxID=1000566 RepID=A0A839E0A8_9PSEU|nr:PP2C family serine/threonine-protein phosphatase [Halosaccharopolyspora lacisalsi]MBA8827632.1 protein phosphatase [Halosaccharopolyspora lacisalsi]